jgi:hypothetical protein
LQVDVHEWKDSITYYLGRNLDAMNPIISDMHYQHHKELEIEGKLDHPLDAKEEALFKELTYLTRPHFN